MTRTSGILLHPTSLPSRWGIGDLGGAAYAFVDFLAIAGQHLWQVMPLGPTGYGDSPYQSFSAFAGNTYLLSPDGLRMAGLLTDEDLADAPTFGDERVDYGAVIPFKQEIQRRAYTRFTTHATDAQRGSFDQFRQDEASWLDDYALFAALKDVFGGAAWNAWDAPLARREPTALTQARADHSDLVAYHAFGQWVFAEQWGALKAYANERGIQIIGDAPIFAAFDSADAWANRELFAIDDAGNPTLIAGVPPDYFSVTGQRWGNPLYKWDAMQARGFDWWIARLRQTLRQVDILRIDHFRGFAGYWAIPAAEETAVHGQWTRAPGQALFAAIRATLGDLPIIAEDLGVITPDVVALRDRCGYPGMRVLQFGFGGWAESVHLPHNYVQNSVVYTGTHDNDTTVGWFWSQGDEMRGHVQHYFGRDGSDIAWDFIRAALASVSDMAIFPLQDVLGLGSEARMNTPGVASGNWGWRLQSDQLAHQHADRLRTLTQLYGRIPLPDADAQDGTSEAPLNQADAYFALDPDPTDKESSAEAEGPTTATRPPSGPVAASRPVDKESTAEAEGA